MSLSQQSRAWLLAAALSSVGCSRPQAPNLHVEVGIADEERLELRPESSFAEYVELRGLRHELRLSLAGYATSCDSFRPPPPGRALVSVVITSPPGEPPRAQTYPHAGPTDRSSSLPSVRIGSRAYELPPGGGITLRKIDLTMQGVVEGELDFQSPGNSTEPARTVRGRFVAHLCRVTRAETE